MKIIDAFWEKRNLGVDTLEIEIEDKDANMENKDIEEKISNCLDKNKHQYYVLKFATGNNDMFRMAKLLDFQFAEVQFDVAIYKQKFITEDYSKITRFNTLVVNEYKDDEHFDYIISKIGDGMFYTDRIALDPHFGIEISNRRYLNWVKDLKGNDDYSISIFSNNDEKVGFSLNKNNGETCYGLLGGLFSDYQTSAWGIFSHYSNIKKVFERYNIFRTSLSSNNIRVIKLWQYFSSEILKMKYVYVKHL